MQFMKMFIGAGAMCLVSSSVSADLLEGLPDCKEIPGASCLPDCKEILSGFGASCKRAKPITYETNKHYFSGSDFNWSCNTIGSLEFDFFNSSKRTVRTVVIEGTTNNTRLTESVFVPPGQSKYIYSLQGKSFCRNEKQARLYFEYKEKNGGGCLDYYSSKEMEEMRAQCKAEADAQRERSAIYDNCVISKSKGVEKSTMRNVRSVCREISENPSQLQRWRWGN
jgi:hypothetical protein